MFDYSFFFFFFFMSSFCSNEIMFLCKKLHFLLNKNMTFELYMLNCSVSLYSWSSLVSDLCVHNTNSQFLFWLPTVYMRFSLGVVGGVEFVSTLLDNHSTTNRVEICWNLKPAIGMPQLFRALLFISWYFASLFHPYRSEQMAALQNVLEVSSHRGATESMATVASCLFCWDQLASLWLCKVLLHTSGCDLALCK